MIDSLYISTGIIAITLFTVIGGIRFQKISAKLSAVIMTIIAFVGAAILEWDDSTGIICVGSLLALAFGLSTLVVGTVLERWVSKMQK